MIRSFNDRHAAALWDGESPRRLRQIRKQAVRRLDALNAAVTLADLRAVPGYRLEALKGDRKGQHSIRINDQFRICFVWTKDDPSDVEIVDYH